MKHLVQQSLEEISERGSSDREAACEHVASSLACARSARRVLIIRRKTVLQEEASNYFLCKQQMWRRHPPCALWGEPSLCGQGQTRERPGRGQGEAGGEAWGEAGGEAAERPGERPGRGRRGTDRGALGKQQHFPYCLERGCEVNVFIGFT